MKVVKKQNLKTLKDVEEKNNKFRKYELNSDDKKQLKIQK